MADETSPDSTAPDRGEPGGDTSTPPQSPEPEWRRRQRLAAVFGDVLPETTSDERDPADGGPDDEAPGDRWLRAQVPPHHGTGG